MWKLKQDWHPSQFKGATFMTSVRWQMLDALKEEFPNARIHLTYGASTKGARRILHMQKSHINDAFCMGMFYPKHRTPHYLYSKKRRNNRVLSKFYDAKYIDSRDGSKKSGQQLFNGRTKRNRTLDTENLHVYRAKKVSKGRTSVRKKHYSIQSGDVVVFEDVKYITKGIQNLEAYLKLDNGKVVPTRQSKILKYANGYVAKRLERSGQFIPN